VYHIRTKFHVVFIDYLEVLMHTILVLFIFSVTVYGTKSCVVLRTVTNAIAKAYFVISSFRRSDFFRSVLKPLLAARQFMSMIMANATARIASVMHQLCLYCFVQLFSKTVKV